MRQGSHQDQMYDSYDRPNDRGILLTTRETIELFANTVDAARDEYRKTLNAEAAGEVLQPRLTVELRKKKLAQIPKEAVEIIKYDVERYSTQQQSWMTEITAPNNADRIAWQAPALREWSFTYRLRILTVFYPEVSESARQQI